MKDQVLNQSLKNLISKNLFLLVLCFLVLPVVYSQELSSNTASATASATIVNEMLGVEKLDNINFENIQAGSTSASFGLQQDLVLTNSAFVKITGTDYDYSVTIPSTDITVQESETFQTMKLGSFSINYSEENQNDKTLQISVTLNVSNKQAAGTYSSITPLVIIINNN